MGISVVHHKFIYKCMGVWDGAFVRAPRPDLSDVAMEWLGWRFCKVSPASGSVRGMLIFIRIAVIRYKCHMDLSGTQSRVLGFQWYAVTCITISMLRSNAYEDFSGIQ